MRRFTAFSFLVAGTAAIAAGPFDSADTVIEKLAAAGHTEVRKLELDDGLWEAEVRGDDGRFYELHVIPETGAILDPRSDRAVLTAAEVRAHLESNGFTDVDDLDLDGAVWEADARDADGNEVDLLINGFDGSVLYSEVDD